MKQATYIAEVQTRLRYQKTMVALVDVLQEHCDDAHLVETILQMTEECCDETLTIEETKKETKKSMDGLPKSAGYRKWWFSWGLT